MELLNQIKKVKKSNADIPKELLTVNIAVTDANAAFFDAANNFHGCIAGLHEVLERQGILKGKWCLDPNEKMSKGQKEEIDRVYKDYPELNDDLFVKDNIQKWMIG